MIPTNFVAYPRIRALLEHGVEPRLTNNPQVTFEARKGPALAAARADLFEKTRSMDNTAMDLDPRPGIVLTPEHRFEMVGDAQLGIVVRTPATDQERPETLLLRVEPTCVKVLEITEGTNRKLDTLFFTHLDRESHGSYYASPVDEPWLTFGKSADPSRPEGPGPTR